MPAFRFVAILSAVLFSGAAMYINLVEHPARMECGTRLAATEFGPSYRRAALPGLSRWRWRLVDGCAVGVAVGGGVHFCGHSVYAAGD